MTWLLDVPPVSVDDRAPVRGGKRQHLDVVEPVQRDAPVEQLQVVRVRLDGDDPPAGSRERGHQKRDDADVGADIQADVAFVNLFADRLAQMVFVPTRVQNRLAEIRVELLHEYLIAAEIDRPWPRVVVEPEAMLFGVFEAANQLTQREPSRTIRR